MTAHTPPAPADREGPAGGLSEVDALAQEIRRVDGSHDLGAGALAEALMPFLAARLAAVRAPDAGLRPRVEALADEWALTDFPDETTASTMLLDLRAALAAEDAE